MDEAVARALAQAEGFAFKQVKKGDEIEPPSPTHFMPSEPLTGQGAGFIAHLVEWQPALIVVELDNVAIPWEGWIAALKSSAATRRIPVVAFSARLGADQKIRAQEVGCEATFTADFLLKNLTGILQQHARLTHLAETENACAQPLSALAQAGIDLHNRGEYFEAHELLERAWNEDASAARELYRGLLQVSVAYLHIERGNYNGALKMFLRMRQWLDPLPAVCRGVLVAQVRQDARAARAALEALGPNRIAEFDRRLFKPFLVTGGE